MGIITHMEGAVTARGLRLENELPAELIQPAVEKMLISLP